MRNTGPKKSVWLIHPYGVTPDYPASPRHFYFGKELAQMGWEVTLWQSSFINPIKAYHNGAAYRFIKSERLGKGLNILWLWGSAYKKNNIFRGINMLSWSLNLLIAGFFKKKPGVILVSSPHPFAAFSGLILSKLFRIPFILEVRDLWPDTLVDMGALGEGFVSRILYRLENWLYRGSSHIITLTEGIRSRIVKKGVEVNKITFLPNGIYLKSSIPPSPATYLEVRKRLGLDGKFVCIYAGAHGPSNSLHTVIKAASLIDDGEIVFLLVGDGTEKPGLIKSVNHLGLKNVIFYGPVPRSEVADYISASDVCILTLKDIPVFETALPNKIFDYMYQNRPVICSVRGEVARLIEDEKLGITVTPESSEELASAVVKLKNSPDLYNTLGECGSMIISERFSFEKISARLESILCSCQ